MTSIYMLALCMWLRFLNFQAQQNESFCCYFYCIILYASNIFGMVYQLLRNLGIEMLCADL